MRFLRVGTLALVVLLLAGCAPQSQASSVEQVNREYACRTYNSYVAANPAPNVDLTSSEGVSAVVEYFASMSDELATLSAGVKDDDALLSGFFSDSAAAYRDAAGAGGRVASGDTGSIGAFTSAMGALTESIGNVTTACPK